VAVITRDKNATWMKPGILCRGRDWSEQRLILELQNGLPFRTAPPGGEHRIDWDNPTVRLDLAAGTVTFHREWRRVVRGDARGVRGTEVTVAFEVLPPVDEVPAPSADAPAGTPAPRRTSSAAVEQCFRDIMKERPDDPPSEAWLIPEMKRRLGASPGRERVRNLWRTIGAQWKRPVGAPRKKISAKKSAE